MLPRIIHRIWIGSALSEDQLSNLLETRNHIIKGNVELWIWTTHSVKLKLSDHIFNNLVIKNITDIYSSLNHVLFGDFPLCHLSSALERERHGCYYNYAAASDIARLLILYRYGGIYLDMDVEFIDTLRFDIFFDLYMNDLGFRLGVLSNSDLMGNAVLASMPYSTAVRRCLKKIANLYFEGPTAACSWNIKRGFGDLRLVLTLDMSGPGLISDLLDSSGMLLFIPMESYFKEVDGSGTSYMTKPKFIRHNSLP